MRKGLLLIATLALIGCKNTKEEEKSTIESITNVQEVVEETQEKVAVTQFDKEENIFLDILVPNYYFKEFHQSDFDKVNDKWLAFEEKKGLYQVLKADYAISEQTNECTESQQIGIFSTGSIEPIFFLGPNKMIKKGTKTAVNIKEQPLWPDMPQEYLFNGKQYILRAEGKQVDSYQYTDDNGKVKKYRKYEDYKLYLVVNGEAEQLVLDIPSFNETFIKVLFVGDLDDDGNLDFVFDTSAEYEIQSVEVYLSKGAQHFIYLAGITSVDFSC
ncbi:hypothetical protein LNQ81_04110 [Myroides sp. M-43]|uniref:hypothetical protein n=1 Tax=Myroides oncorhynchi TaxID=2893756 RepID=UPI001E2ACB64|nr:hypothetical protein [Myroides oncorhynchi]MCC9041885.1 hypothetical protein [Myroides oncorhynchi]